MRLDIPALGPAPLGLEEVGVWDPKHHYWGEPGERKEEWAKPIIKQGKRIEYEMEHLLPGEDPDDPDMDPIIEAIELEDAGDHRGADRVLMALLTADLRCLDAHAHLGNSIFDHSPEKAIRHYEMGVRIGELSLGGSFNGLLPWGHIDNRPFLRCLQGYGLSLWRLRRFKEAEDVFIRMLWLNPSDNQGVRFVLDEVRKGKVWRADYWIHKAITWRDHEDARRQAKKRRGAFTREFLLHIYERVEKFHGYLLREDGSPDRELFRSLRRSTVDDCEAFLLERVFEFAHYGLVDEAVTIGRWFSEASSQSENFLSDVGCVLAEAGRADEALEQIEENLPRFPDDV
jgi:tetratricopeptide (TPR) repeat protein